MIYDSTARRTPSSSSLPKNTNSEKSQESAAPASNMGVTANKAVMNGNGYSNGSPKMESGKATHTDALTVPTHYESPQHMTATNITIVSETWSLLRGKQVQEFDDIDDDYLGNVTIERFLEYIQRERLTDMPHRGSKWDKVLKCAEYFALQISSYAQNVEAFVPSSRDAAILMLADCQMLLDVRLALKSL